MSLKFLREIMSTNGSINGRKTEDTTSKKGVSFNLTTKQQKRAAKKPQHKKMLSTAATVAKKASDLECPICMECMHQPVKTSCGHTFCFYCVVCLDRCPICRQVLDQEKGDFEVDDYLNLSLGIHFHPRTLAKREQTFASQGYAPVEVILERRKAYPPGTTMPSSKLFKTETSFAEATAPKAHMMYSSGGFMKRRAPSLVTLSNDDDSRGERRIAGNFGSSSSSSSSSSRGLSSYDRNLPLVVDSPREAIRTGEREHNGDLSDFYRQEESPRTAPSLLSSRASKLAAQKELADHQEEDSLLMNTRQMMKMRSQASLEKVAAKTASSSVSSRKKKRNGTSENTMEDEGEGALPVVRATTGRKRNGGDSSSSTTHDGGVFLSSRGGGGRLLSDMANLPPPPPPPALTKNSSSSGLRRVTRKSNTNSEISLGRIARGSTTYQETDSILANLPSL